MTIEELDILAGYLYAEAEQGAPLVKHPERKEWMAGKIKEAIHHNNALLLVLLACENTDQVLDRLGSDYRKLQRQS
ncbi:MAG: hypothetical protein LUE98_21485 [Tannerellaceae bacterium]|nr:hypothetical protein [Tannerellaceae bacterium]MCD8179829.1 hypothetical protein [Tannerellaceae bacterium]